MHHRKSPRASWYEYTAPGAYFVTICTKNRVHYFGEVVEGVMNHSMLGYICAQEIVATTIHRPHIRIDAYVVMPNHTHILLIVDEIPNQTAVGTYGNTSHCNTYNDNFKQMNENNTISFEHDALPRVPTQTLGSIIRNIKSRVTKYANSHHIPFARQSRYHDHIIRNEQAYDRIKRYIRQNPQNRKKDCFGK